MKTLIVYDSVFGNTKELALHLANSIEDGVAVHVQDVRDLSDFKLVVIGSPTRAFQPTNDIKQILKRQKHSSHLTFAFFDTRMDMSQVQNRFLSFMVKRFGYATDSLDKIARKKRLSTIPPPMGFYVNDSEGPLKDGELQRASAWIQDILTNLEEEQ